MLLSDWLNDVMRSHSHPSRKSLRAVPSFAEIETLEDRCLLSTFTVTNLNDSGAGSLRQAVINSNNAGGRDDIRFSQDLLNTSRVIALTSGQITITDSVYILGPTFDPAGIIVSGNNSDRVFRVAAAAQNVTLQFFTVSQGSTGSNGGGIANAGPNTVLKDMVISSNQAIGSGGGISVDSGRVEIQRSKILNNTAFTNGGGIVNTGGTLVINQTTIDSNVAVSGGGILTQSGSPQTTIANSTISHNTAANGRGGGIASLSTTSTALTLQNSTIAGNVSRFGGGGISAEAGTVMVMNVTIANNLDFSTASDSAGGLRRIGGGTVTGINLIVSQNTGGNNDNTNGVTAINGAASHQNFINGNPQLGPLQDNGGPTFTMMPLPGSPVLGAGDSNPAVATTLDQRGYARNVSAGGGGAPSVDQGAVEFFPTLTQPYAVSPGVNSGNLASRAYNATSRNGNARFSRQAYGPAGFEVRIALGDINGDGTKDIITAPGPGFGVSSHVEVLNGVDPSQVLANFFAYEGFFGGVFVAAGDLTGDGIPEVLTGSGAGGLATIRIVDVSNPNFPPNLLATVFPFANFFGGIHVASGDVNGDGRADLIVSAGAGGGSRVRVYNGMTVVANPNNSSVIADFFAYGGFFGGVFVAAGDVNGDGKDEIITGPGPGGGPHVKVFNQSGQLLSQLFAYSVNFTGGVRVGAVDANGDGFADIITGAGPGGGPHVRVFDGLILSTFGGGIDLASFFAFDPFDTGGVYVAGSDARTGGGSPLLLADGIYDSAPAPPPTAEDLANLTGAAIQRFAAAGLNAYGVSLLEHASVELSDLPGTLLGLTFGNRVLIDPDAAGAGYFIDNTPGGDNEFSQTGIALVPNAQGRVDLLTVIAHELGHVLGLPDEPSDIKPAQLMADRLAPGVRRFVREEDLAALDSAFQTENLDALLN